MPAAAAVSTSPVPFVTSTSRSSIVTLTRSLTTRAPRELGVALDAPFLVRPAWEGGRGRSHARGARTPRSRHHLERPPDLCRPDVPLVDVRRRDDPVERRRAVERATGFLDVLEELLAELRDVARDGDRVGVAERAQARAVDSLAHVEQEVEVAVRPVAGLDLLQDLREPARPDAAGRALAAGLVLVELRDADAELHHAAPVVEHDHGCRADRRAGLREGVEVERHLLGLGS